MGSETKKDVQLGKRDRNYSPHIWNAVRLNPRGRVNWTMAVGVMSALTVSAAAWIGVATMVSKLMH
ncbi:MAG: hypothetical protein H0X25_14810 [Acidobacteriales bacterium]|nr:hypothetical protein [Terriglobales bacterium]